MTRAQAERLEKRITAVGLGDVSWQWDGNDSVSLCLIFRDGAQPNQVFASPEEYDLWRLGTPTSPTRRAPSAGTFSNELRPGDGPLAQLLFGDDSEAE